MRRLGTLVRRAVGAALTVVGVGLVTGGVADAAGGLRFENTTTYVLDPVAGVVSATVELRLTNELRDERDGDVVRRPYFRGVTVPVPSDATNVVATADGDPLEVTVTPQEGTRLSRVDIAFDRDLFAGRSLDVTATFDLTGRPPRSEDPSRVNAAYAAFPAYAVGDPGLTNVRIVVPAEYDVEVFGDPVVESVEEGSTILSAAAIEDPEEWFVFVSARRDAALAVTPGQVGDIRFDVGAWPGDDEWAHFVTSTVQSGLPVLETLIGRPWPLEGTLAIREAITPYFYGYAGWFDASRGEIEMGEDLDQDLVLHELSHAWFNEDLFEDRWVSEGMAQTYAALAAAELGSAVPEPLAVDVGGAGYVPLAEWVAPPLGEDAATVEEYGYNASWSVVDALADELGTDTMAAILAAVDAGTLAYAGDAPARPRGAATWEALVDLAEEIGGSTQFEPLVRRLVVDPADVGRLDDRLAARAAYERLEVAGGAWTPPLGVRVAMANWDFARATRGIDAASEVVATRDELARRAAVLELVPPAATEAAYEEATGGTDALADVQATLDAQVVAVAELEELDAVHDAAEAGFADADLEADLGPVVRPAGDAFEAGAVDDVAELATTAATEIAAWVEDGRALDAAMDEEAGDRGLFERIGLRGDDLDGDLARARAAFAAGDRQDAARIAADVRATLDGADAEGKRVAAVVASALLLLVALAIVLRRLLVRRRRSADATSSTVATPGASGEDVTGQPSAPVVADRVEP